jgi:hypothetical protein
MRVAAATTEEFTGRQGVAPDGLSVVGPAPHPRLALPLLPR